MGSASIYEKGMCLLEAALWLVAMFPVGLAGLSVMALVNDLTVISHIPHAVLRDLSVSGLRWVPDGKRGRFEADLTSLRIDIKRIARRAVDEADRGLLKAGPASSKACFWIFSVNSSTGALESPIQAECDAQGPLGEGLLFTDYIQHEVSRAQGIPLGSGNGFADRVVATGVVVGADAWRFSEPGSRYQITRAAISFARQEVML